jgi:hypothetical protein
MLQGSQATNNYPDPSVRIVATQAKYCLGQPGGNAVPEHQRPGTITLRLRLEVSYRNQSSKPLILSFFKDSTLIVSRTLVDVARHQRQLAVQLGVPRPRVNVEDDGIDEPIAPYFEVIQPREEGRTHSSKYVVLSVHDPSTGPETDLLGKTIFLQLELDHDKLEEGLSEKWRRYGYLWTGKVRSNPIEIHVPLSPPIASCAHEYGID